MERIYFKTKSNGKCGCSTSHLWYTDKYRTIAQLRKALSNGFYGKLEWAEKETKVVCSLAYPNNIKGAKEF